LDLPHFTLVGATTRTGLVSGPLRDRFGFVGRLDLYAPADLRAIVERSARILHVEIDQEGATRISERSRGTPRVANRLLRRVRDFAEVRGDGSINGATAAEGLDLFGVDELGLDKVDRAILHTLCASSSSLSRCASRLRSSKAAPCFSRKSLAFRQVVHDGFCRNRILLLGIFKNPLRTVPIILLDSYGETRYTLTRRKLRPATSGSPSEQL
jgi:hypothetical protein